MIASGCDDSGLCAVCDISRDDVPRSKAKSARKSRALCANSQTLFRALTRKSYEILRGRAIQKAAVRSKYNKQSWKYDVYFLSPHQLEKRRQRYSLYPQYEGWFHRAINPARDLRGA